MDNTTARITTMGLGLWLFISAFVWPHSQAHFVNTVMMGAIVVLSSAIALKVPGFRMVTAAAGVWSMAALFAWPELEPITVWHNFMIGGAISLASLVGSTRADQPSSKQSHSTA